jgi:Lipocalin-like domain
MAQHPIIGTWALDSIEYEEAHTGERFNMYGERPSGYIMINADGHAIVLIADSSRAPPQNPSDKSDLFNTMMSYAGTYTLEGDNTFTTKVTSAWHPSWVGTDQVRYFEVKGDILAITTALQTHPNFPGRKGRGVVKWHRAGLVVGCSEHLL